MGFRKLIFVAFVALEGVLSQCVPAPKCSCVSSSPITPVGQFVIPAVIKPLLQPEPVVVATPAPVVETIIESPAYGGIPAPYSMYPPIIVQDDDDNSHTWLYWLMLAMNRRNNCGCGNNWNGCNNCGYGYNNGYGGSCGCGNGCGNVYPFAPYPLPCGPSIDCGYPINPCGNGPEINLIIRTPDDCPVASAATASS